MKSKTSWFFIGIFVVLTAISLLEYKLVGQAVYGDGRYYWAFTRSMYFDHNIDISDEMGHYYSPESNNKPAVFQHIPSLKNETRRITHSFSLGISVIWLPLYFLADMIVLLAQFLGLSTVRNGYSDLYQTIVGVGNILLIVAGLMLLNSILRRWFTQKTVFLSLILLIFTTNLLYYGSLDVVNSHPLSFFLVSLLLWLYFRSQKKRSNVNILLQGLIVGILVGNRTQDVFFILIPLAAIILQKKQKFISYVSKGTLLIIGSGIGYLPQFLLLLHGQKQFLILAHTDQHFNLFQLHVFNLLFNPKLGIAYYMPIFIIAAFGLFLFRKHAKKETILFICIFLLHYVLIASWTAWDQASYTMRYFISCLPLLAFGLSEIVKRLQKRFSNNFLYMCILIFIIHQFIMIAGFKIFLQDPTFVGAEISRTGKLKLEILNTLEQLYNNLKFSN